MHEEAPPRFVPDRRALDALSQRSVPFACPHCGAHGTLIGHGFLRGYAEQTSDVVIRGRRLFCSNRGLKKGCGRTWSVLLANVIARCTLTVGTLGAFVCGLARHQGSERAARACHWPFSMRSAYRLNVRLQRHVPRWKAWLNARVPAPTSQARHPLGQVVEHFRCMLGEPQLENFQLVSGTSVL